MHNTTMVKTFGEALNPDQRVDATVYLSPEETMDALFKAAVEKAGAGTWRGHILIQCNGDAGRVSATVYLWRNDKPVYTDAESSA